MKHFPEAVSNFENMGDRVPREHHVNWKKGLWNVPEDLGEFPNDIDVLEAW